MPAHSIRKHERCRAAVHDRHFRAVDFDNQIGDAATDDRRHQMLDRVDLHAIDIADGRAELRVGDAVETRGDRSRNAGMIGAAKNDARTFGRRKQSDGGHNAGVDSNALTNHPIFNRRLKRHYPSQNTIILSDQRGNLRPEQTRTCHEDAAAERPNTLAAPTASDSTTPRTALPRIATVRVCLRNPALAQVAPSPRKIYQCGRIVSK